MRRSARLSAGFVVCALLMLGLTAPAFGQTPVPPPPPAVDNWVEESNTSQSAPISKVETVTGRRALAGARVGDCEFAIGDARVRNGEIEAQDIEDLFVVFLNILCGSVEDEGGKITEERAMCPTGMKVIGGGARVEEQRIADVIDSYPLGDDGWVAHFRRNAFVAPDNDGRYPDTHVSVTAICADYASDKTSSG